MRWVLLVPLLAASSSFCSAGAVEEDAGLVWGTYRPGLYFGLKPRIPNSFLTGLAWFGVHDYQSASKLRHVCDTNDALRTYTFTEHDGRSYAKQTLEDEANNVKLTTSWLKIPGGDHGGSWSARIEGEPIHSDKISRIALVNYFANDGQLGFLQLDGDGESEPGERGIQGDIRLSGMAAGLDNFTVRVVASPSNRPVTPGPQASHFGDQLDRVQYLGVAIPAGQAWQAKAIVQSGIYEKAQPMADEYRKKEQALPDPALLLSLPNTIQQGSKFYAFEHVFEGKWSVDVHFESASAVGTALDSDSLSAGLEAASIAFNERFDRTFPLESFSSAERDFAQHITSNLIGGIGYFHGSSIIDRTFAHEWDDEDAFGKPPQPELTPPRELLTATPSRSFFPRGFYWDEGFHLELIGAWDNDLGLEILKDWLKLVDEDGWVAREQILGEEARSRVPPEFQAQYPRYANPPTLAMAVTAYIRRLQRAGVTLESFEPEESAPVDRKHVEKPRLAGEFLREIYPTLKRHYHWFRKTQRGQVTDWGRRPTNREEGYRWRGRTKDHVLTSGLDDYPRAVPPHFGELHLDLISWMGFFTRTMGEIATFLGEEEDSEDFEEYYDAILANIDDLHWSEEQQMYCDASVSANDDSVHVCHEGYISLFPFLLGLVPADSPKLLALLELIQDPERLWSPYGIRSLSKKDEHFGQGENYWRGPIWIQMNYLALSSLHKHYAGVPGPYQTRAAQLYDKLRRNVIANVFSEYQRTGYVWEQYDPLTGQGKRSHPFTGWSSLVTLIMTEQYQ